MHKRYDIETREVAPAASVPNKFKPVVNRAGLARMLVKEAFHYRFNKQILLSRPCIYGVFSGPVGGFAPIREKCVGCMRCVEEYPDICQVFIDERYKRLGDDYFTADAVATLNFEAATGKIQVKGVGYKGKFAGAGFDSMWTDMSEIVRPTRDGIYGREYISTSVDVGRRPRRLDLEERPEPMLEIPLPIIFDEIPRDSSDPTMEEAVRAASRRLGTLFVSAARPPEADFPSWVPLLRGPEELPAGVRMAEYEDPSKDDVASLRSRHPGVVLAARLDFNERTLERIKEFYSWGLGAFHLRADVHGMELGSKKPRFIKDALLDLHRGLVAAGIRNELTLIVSGGIVRAEHVPKAILCGADLVALDTPIPVALGAKFESGRMARARVDPAWGAQRLVNFCASWRNQLLEISSAMGIREVRRMRGETGRAIFFEELEKEAFSDLCAKN